MKKVTAEHTLHTNVKMKLDLVNILDTTAFSCCYWLVSEPFE